MNKAILIDLDGTLTDFEHRRHLFEKKQMIEFYSELGNDSVNEWCRELIIAMKKQSYQIIYVTARPFEYKAATISWMIEHDIPHGLLLTSPYNLQTKKPDETIKKELYETRIKEKYDVLFVIDDRSKVVRNWRELGLVCLQPYPGDY